MNASLVLLKENGSQKVFPLSGSTTVIGRRNDCDLFVPLASVSRKHCQLIHDKKTSTIQDLDSRNGTCLNGARIKDAAIRAGDTIEVGPLKFLFQVNGLPRITPKATTKISNSPQKQTQADNTI